MPAANRFDVTLDQLTMDDVPPGSRITTPQGDGRLNYVRLSGPEYLRIAAVSVMLFHKAETPNYSGTIYAAEKVRLYKERHHGG